MTALSSTPPTPTPATISREVAMQAAEWFVRLHSEEASLTDQRACEAWRAQSPVHESAWQRALSVSQRAGAIPAAVGSPTLGRAQRRIGRRDTVRALAVLIVAAPAGWMAWRVAPTQRWLATHATATGEVREWTLADGSRIVLDTASAADVRFDSARRHIHLRSGAIFVETAPDPSAASRPFIVSTVQGDVRAIGTRFSVRSAGEYSDVAVLQGAVEVTLHATGAVRRIQAVQQMRFGENTLGAVEPASVSTAQWARGVLAVNDARLGDFVAELARYRTGLLRCDPAVADLRISGAFQLRDTDAVLENVVHLLPVAVHYRTRYWVTIAQRE